MWWISALYIVLLLGYSIMFPAYRSPDEPLHIDLMHLFSEEQQYPAWDEGYLSDGMTRSLSLAHFGTNAQNLTTEGAVPKHERPSYEDLEAAGPPLATQSINQLSQHPPLHYVVAGSAMWGLEAVFGDPIGAYDREAWVYRLFSIMIVAPLPLIIWRTAGVLRLPRSLRYAAMLVPLTIPQFVHISSTANNDSLSFILFCALTPVVLRVADGHLAARTALLAGGLTGAGLLTKGFATIMVLWITAALVVALLRRGRTAVRPVAGFGLVFAGVGLATGGWWWIRNLVLYGQASPSRFDQLVRTLDRVEVDFWRYVSTWAYRTNRRFWGQFGWFEISLPSSAILVATLVAVAAIVLAVVRRSRVAVVPLATRLLLLFPLVALMATQFQRGLAEYARTGTFPGLQGRYWFGAIAAISILIALGIGTTLRGRARWTPVVVLCGATVMQILTVIASLSYYWGAPGSGLADRVRAVVAWAPLPGELIALGLLVGLATITGSVWQVVRLVRADDRDVAGATTA